ncbi:Uncharacterized zinc protease YmxG [Geodia barretti]|uniref:Uncharacterized zinc protease YmxG n=1 Tax=Geodia barretti TaxID=519541 RepID=A0AA35W271_GEOBA|nr:Uncharacterized zinc protease YmxG [Geodia barretti]
MAHQHLQPALYPLPHPYHWMTIGSQEDLDAASLEDVKEFFQRFYGPSNASLAIAGDFRAEEALDLVNRYFGDLPRVDIEMRDKVTLPRLYIAWPAPTEGHPDDAPLELYQAVMSDGLSSRLHRSLVYEKQIAQHSFIRYVPSEIAGQLLVQLARIGGFGGRADQLNHFNVIESDPNLINTSLDRCLAVRPEDILRVAETYVSGNQVRLRVLPETQLSAAATTVDRNIMPPPTDEPVFTPPLPIRGGLPNGMGVTVVEQRGMPIVAFGVLLGSGASAYPADLPGLAGLVGDMLPEGAAGKSSQQIANDFEFIGARLSVDSRREYSLLSTETLTKHWGSALEMMAEVILSPDFPQHELDRLRREHLTDLHRSKDEPNAIAERLLAGLIYPTSSGYAHPVSGTEASIQAISRDNLVDQFRRSYRPENAHFLVVGDIDREEVMRRAAAAFGTWNAYASGSAPADWNELSDNHATIYLVDRPGAPQSVIRAVESLVPRLHPDYFPLLLANYSFGVQFSARLNQNLRQDKGYSYGYMSSIQWQRRQSMLVAGGSVQSNATKESVYETLKEFREVSGERPITAEELSNAKDGLLRAYPASFERPASVLGQLLAMEQFGLPDDYFRSVRPSIEAITLEDVHRVAQGHIRPGNLQILVVGDRASTQGLLSELGLPLVHLTEDGETTS